MNALFTASRYMTDFFEVAKQTEIPIKSVKKDEIAPFDIVSAFKKGSGFYYKGKEFITHSSLDHKDIALFQLTFPQKFILFVFLGIILFELFINWHATIT